MDIFSSLTQLILVAVLLINIVLAFVVYRNNPKSATNIMFVLLSLITSVWLVVINRATMLSIPSAILMYTRFTIFLAVPQSVLFFLLSYTVPSNVLLLKKHSLFLMLLGTAGMMVLTLSPYVFTEVQIIGTTIKSIPGPGMPFFAIFTSFFSIGAIYVLIKKIRNSTGQIRKQLFFIMRGILLMLGLIITTIMIPVMLFQNQMFIPFAPLYVLIFLGMTAYAIVKYRLFNIKVIVTEALTAILWIALFAKAFVSENISQRIVDVLIFGVALVFGILLIRSARKEVEQREKLEELDKLKTEFMRIAAHDVKSPMNVVKGFAQLIYDGSEGKVSDNAKETALKIKARADQTIGLVDDLLDMEKIEAGKMEYNMKDIDIVKLAKDTADDFRVLAAEKKLALQFESNVPSFVTKADERRMREVFQNLVGNSIKFTDSGGVKVSISGVPSTSSGNKDFSASTEDKNGILITVSDTGRGMSKDLLAKLFERFVRDEKTAKEVQGTGLGLFISKEFVLAHGGEIWAESEGEGKGSRFFVKLKKF